MQWWIGNAPRRWMLTGLCEVWSNFRSIEINVSLSKQYNIAMRTDRSLTNAGADDFRDHESFTPEEIIAAGGAIAFGKKQGKNNQSMVNALKEAHLSEPFSNVEWNNLMKQLAETK